MSAIRDSIPSVAASSIFCSRSAAAAWVELLAVADEAPGAGAAPGFGGRFMTLYVRVGEIEIKILTKFSETFPRQVV